MKPRKYRKPKGRYLEHRVTTRIRFQEVDMLGMVWHGHYLSYFEDARTAFGNKYGLNYSDIREAGLVAPVVQVSCDFLSQTEFADEIEIAARLMCSKSPKIEFYYEVKRLSDSKLLATGTTIQAITDQQGRLILTVPDYLKDFYAKWENQMVSTDE